MAFFHLHAQVISRSSGRSSVAAAAYRSTERLTDERTATEHDFTRKDRATHTEIMKPENTPEWMADREKLWNGVEAAERKSNSQVAREFNMALPAEFTKEQNTQMVREWAQRNFVDRGAVVDIAIHRGSERDEYKNVHAHVMVTTREATPEGFGKKMRDMNEKSALKEWRRDWSQTVNRELERTGSHERISEKTLKDQGIERVPSVHRGMDMGSNERQRGYREERAELENLNAKLDRMGGIREDLATVLNQRDAQLPELEKREHKVETKVDRELEKTRERVDPEHLRQVREAENQSKLDKELDMGRGR